MILMITLESQEIFPYEALSCLFFLKCTGAESQRFFNIFQNVQPPAENVASCLGFTRASKQHRRKNKIADILEVNARRAAVKEAPPHHQFLSKPDGVFRLKEKRNGSGDKLAFVSPQSGFGKRFN